MKLNKNSWHYKLWCKSFTYAFDAPETTNLCQYTHRVFLQILNYVFMGIVALIGIAMFGLIGFKLFLSFRNDFWMTTGITLGISAAVLLLVGYFSWALDSEPKLENKENKTFVGVWLRARKERICPVIEFSDDESGKHPSS